MGIKKKLGMGIATGALAVTMIGGGTFAYFSDTETVENTFASGTLELDVSKQGSNPAHFDLSNLKPGDTMRRAFDLENSGSLAIKNVWLESNANGFEGQEGVSLGEYLDQFEVNFYRSKGDDTYMVFDHGKNPTLRDLVNGKDLSGFTDDQYLDDSNTRVDIAHGGLDADPQQDQRIEIELEFVDDGDQNQFQGATANIDFNLEATQDSGTHNDYNGNNGKMDGNAQTK